jgi:hypothetical protein
MVSTMMMVPMMMVSTMMMVPMMMVSTMMMVSMLMVFMDQFYLCAKAIPYKM